MNINLITIGKSDFSWLRQGMEMYISRLGHYCRFTLCEIPELKNISSLSREQIKKKEAELLFSRIKDKDELILLDERGSKFSSINFAKFLEKKMLYSSKSISFVVGGSYGFSQEVYDRATSLISLSDMTYSHQIIRLIFLEQLYRAFTIINAEPYHHE